MTSIKIILALLIIWGAGALISNSAQEIEYGDPIELKGVTKIFVNTRADLELRKAVIEEIHKKLPKLGIVSRPDDAEIHLRFYREEVPSADDPSYRIEGPAAAVIEKPISENRVRLIMQLKPIKRTGWAKVLPSKDYFASYPVDREHARAFVKVYEEVNAKH